MKSDSTSSHAREFRRYAIAAILSLVAMALTVAMSSFLAPMRLFFLWCAVLLTSFFAGAGPAIFATFLCSLGAAFLIFRPANDLSLADPIDLLRLLMFIGFAGGISAIGSMRQRAEERARESDQWLVTTLASIGDAVIATDRAGRIAFMNRVAEELTGWKSDEAIGYPLEQVFAVKAAATGEQLESPVHRVLTTGEAVTLANHTVLARRDGSEVPIDDSAAPIRSLDGSIGGVVLVFHDVSSRYALERARLEALADLQLSEQRYRTLVEAVPVAQAVWTATPDGVINWSRDWFRITGQNADEVAGADAMGVVHPQDREATLELWKTALQTTRYYDDEIRVRVADGRYRWFAIRAVPVRDTEGRVSEWIGVIADIHPRKRLENETRFINRATDLLSSSFEYEETLRTVAEICVPELGDWCAIDIAKGKEPYQRLAVQHRDRSKVDLVLALDRVHRLPPEIDPIAEVMRTGNSHLQEVVPDDLLQQLSVSPEQLEVAKRLNIRSWMIVPIIARGRTLGSIAIVSAESGRRYTEEDLPLVEELARRAGLAIDNARLFRDAEEANRAKDEFLATLSHELRTPLTSIVGWAGMLKSHDLDDETKVLAIDTILRSARSQGELIDDLLDLSQVVTGRIELRIETVDLVRLASEVVVSGRPAAESKELQLSFDSSESSLIVRADERRIRQVIWNLLTNAIKFTPVGGAIRIAVKKGDGSAMVEIVDTGRGIDPSFIPHVWERFRQYDSSTTRQFGGLGLGLSVVRHLTELHGGSVFAESAGEGKGSRFVVTLPLTSRLNRATEPVRRADDGHSLNHCRILLVDDEHDTRQVLSLILERTGAEVTTAASAAQARSLFESSAFDLVVSDLAMPDEDGFALLGHLRRQSKLPVVALSAVGGAGERSRILAAGFDEFIRKPVEPQELTDTLASVVAAHRGRV